MVTAVRPVLVGELDKTKEGQFSLMAGSVLRVRFVTGAQAGEIAPGPALPVFVVNQAPGFRLPDGTTIEGGEPLLIRAVLDREPTSYVAIPVYAED